MNFLNMGFDTASAVSSPKKEITKITTADAEQLKNQLNYNMEQEKFDYKNLFKAPYVWYMAVGVAVGMYVLPKVLKKGRR